MQLDSEIKSYFWLIVVNNFRVIVAFMIILPDVLPI